MGIDLGGFLGDVGRSVSDFTGKVGDVAKQVAGGLPISGGLGGIAGGLPGIVAGYAGGDLLRKQVQGGGPDRPAPPGEDPALERMRKQQLDIASGLKDPFGEYQTEKYGVFRNSQLRDLADTNKQASHSMSSRGLYGPGAQGVQAKNVATTSKNLATGKGLIRSGAEEKAREIENSVLNNALEQKQTSQQMYDTIFNSALNEFRQRREALKSVGQGIGAVAGSAYGGPAAGVGGAYAGGEFFS